MRNFIIASMLVAATISSADAQYGNRYGDDAYGNQSYGYDNYDDDRYYYDDEFDWHWDVRVRISNGIQNGRITRNEANRLYRRLENVERKEYAYQSDGIYSTWEQQEIWDDIVYLNRQIGIELYDFDRTFYGFNNWGYDFRGYNRWFYHGGYDFYRFDRRGFGSIRLGYLPRPNYNGWYRHNNNRVGREYYSERSRYYGNNGRNSNPRGNERGGSYDNNRNERSSRGSVDNDRRPSDYGRNDRNSQPNSNPSGGYSRGNDNGRGSQPSTDYGRGSQGNNGGIGSEAPRRSRPDVNVEPNRSDNFGRGSGMESSRSERSTFPQEGNGRMSRGERSGAGSSPSVERPSRTESSPSRSSESPRGNDGGGRSESRGRRN